MSGTNEIHSSIDRSKRRDVWHRNWNRSLFAFLPYILFTESTHYELLSMPICLHFFFYFTAVCMQCLIVIFYPFAPSRACSKYLVIRCWKRLYVSLVKIYPCFRLKNYSIDRWYVVIIIESSLWKRKESEYLSGVTSFYAQSIVFNV